MDYVLWSYYAVASTAIYGAIWTLGGPATRMLLTFGLYAYHPAYETPSRRWRRAQTDFRTSNQRHAAGAYGAWKNYLADPAPVNRELRAAFSVPPPEFATPGIDNAPTVIVPRLMPTRDDHDRPGAEHWGTLLEDMTTEERTIYSAEMVQVYEETKAVERPFLDGLDAVIANFTERLAELDHRHPAMYEGLGVNLAKWHGGAERWSTGQYVIIPREYEPAP